MSKKEVLVLFKTHLDVGFTDYSENIVKEYLENYIPKAIKVGYELKGTDTPFVWIVGSWMINEALKHDENCVVEQAIRDGILTWHALPFTTHTELLNKKLFEYGISISKQLDKRFSKHTIAAKMTDVPGHTIGMVPIMHDADIRFLHIGVNQATPLPPVPPIFKWKYDNKEIIVMYQGDYGEVAEFDDFIVYFAHTHDNLGPQSANEVKKIYKTICNEYPDYKIKAATLDDVARRIETLKDLPIIDKEIGDTWIHGAGTDPQKISRYRNVLRYISEHKNSDVDLTDNLLLIPEHTCGMDVKTHFHDLRHYTPLQMNKCKDKRRKIEKSWEEQRNYVYNAEKLLNIKTDYPINEPDISLYEETEIPDNFNIEVSWQIFDRDDYNRYKKDYMRSRVYWAIWDFTKVGLPQYQRDIYDAKIVKCYKNGDDIIYKLEFDSQIAKKHGLPYFYLQLKENRIELKWFGKKASRIPQACWLKIKGLNEDWELNKMDVWIKPDDILGSPLISAVDQGVRNKDYVIKPLDSVLVAPYGRKLLQYNVKEKNQDLYFNLYNNIWNTNFPIWYSDDALFRFDILQITN